MKTRKYSILVILIWEIVRLFLLYLVVVSVFHREIQADKQAMYWLLAIGSPQVIMFALLIFLFLDPFKFANYLNLLRVIKVLNIFTMFLVLINFQSNNITENLQLKVISFSVYVFPLTLMILFLDLIFFALLISYRIKQKKKNEFSGSYGLINKKNELPDFEELEVTDNSKEV